MLPVAAHLSCLVHGDGDRRDIGQVIARLAEGEKDALLVVLAGLVPPDVPLGWLLAYLTWDEHGKAASPPSTTETLRDIASDDESSCGLQEVDVDEAAVLRALEGENVPLNRDERRSAVVHGMTKGMGSQAVADALGMTQVAVDAVWTRARKRAREAGAPVPECPRWAKTA
jgi:hypothetical protein